MKSARRVFRLHLQDEASNHCCAVQNRHYSRLPAGIRRLSTRTSNPNEVEKWKEMTEQLFEASALQAHEKRSSRMWHQAEKCLNYWCKQRQLEPCLKILDHMARNNSSGKKVHTEWYLNPIVKLWRSLLIAENSDDQMLLPSEMSRKLEQYARNELIVLDKATHSMILDAASQITHRHPKEGVLFAQDYLQKWIERSLPTANNKEEEAMAKPDVVAFGSVVHAWLESDLPEAPDRATQLLEVFTKTLGLEPSIQLYTSVLAAWAKVGNPLRAQQCMDTMVQNNVKIDLVAWNSLLSAWAHADPATLTKDDSKSPAQHAESILNTMFRLHDLGKLEEAPDVISYSTVLDAWAKQVNRVKSPKQKKFFARKALQLLGQMKESSNPKARPNTISYNSVLATCARAGLATNAESLMKEMIQEYRGSHGTCTGSENEKDDVGRIKPNIQSISLLILAYSNLGTAEGAEKAETVLKDTLPILGMKPNVQTYSNCISCWARASSPKSTVPVERASQLFREISLQHGMKPDVVAYTALMNAWGRHGEAHQAQALLDELWELYQDAAFSRKEDALAYKPTVQTLTTVLHAWANCDPEQAEGLLKRMSFDYQVSPNVFSFSVVMKAWANHATSPQYPNAPDRALTLLNHMRETSKMQGLRPNVISYSTVIQAFAKQGRAEEAEALLQEMLFASDDDTGLKPDAHSFSAVLYAWSKSRGASAADRAEALLVRMHELYKAKELDQPPNVFCYTNVLSCLAHSRKTGSARRALMILRSMEQNSSIAPTLVSYNICINAFANEIGRQRKKKDAHDKSGTAFIEQVFELLDELVEKKDPRLEPDEFTFRTCCKAINHLRSNRRMEYANRVLDVMRIQGFEPTSNFKRQISQLFQ